MQVLVDQAELDTLRKEVALWRAQFEQRDLALKQTQQMLFTVVFAQPEHSVTLQEADFMALPDFPRMMQRTEGGAITLIVRDAKASG